MEYWAYYGSKELTEIDGKQVYCWRDSGVEHRVVWWDDSGVPWVYRHDAKNLVPVYDAAPGSQQFGGVLTKPSIVSTVPVTGLKVLFYDDYDEDEEGSYHWTAEVTGWATFSDGSVSPQVWCDEYCPSFGGQHLVVGSKNDVDDCHQVNAYVYVDGRYRIVREPKQKYHSDFREALTALGAVISEESDR